MTLAWVVPWHIMMPAFLGMMVIAVALTWVVARWLYRATWERRLPERIQKELALRNERIRHLTAENKELHSTVGEQCAIFRGIISLAGNAAIEAEARERPV